MTFKSLRLSDLAGLSEDDRNRKLSELIAETREPATAEQMAAVDARIAAFEAQHGMTSEVMERRLHAGEIRETYAVCQWLMALDMQRRASVGSSPERDSAPEEKLSGR